MLSLFIFNKNVTRTILLRGLRQGVGLFVLTGRFLCVYHTTVNTSTPKWQERCNKWKFSFFLDE